MILYRTDEFSKNRTTDIVEVLLYELFDRENESLFENLLSISLNDEFKDTLSLEYKALLDYPDREGQREFVKTLVGRWNFYYKRDFKYAIWLYPLENVQAYVEFNACDEMLPPIYGYETSGIAVISYENEGTLYFYDEEPEIKEKV